MTDEEVLLNCRGRLGDRSNMGDDRVRYDALATVGNAECVER